MTKLKAWLFLLSLCTIVLLVSCSRLSSEETSDLEYVKTGKGLVIKTGGNRYKTKNQPFMRSGRHLLRAKRDPDEEEETDEDEEEDAEYDNSGGQGGNGGYYVYSKEEGGHPHKGGNGGHTPKGHNGEHKPKGHKGHKGEHNPKGRKGHKGDQNPKGHKGGKGSKGGPAKECFCSRIPPECTDSNSREKGNNDCACTSKNHPEACTIQKCKPSDNNPEYSCICNGNSKNGGRCVSTGAKCGARKKSISALVDDTDISDVDTVSEAEDSESVNSENVDSVDTKDNNQSAGSQDSTEAKNESATTEEDNEPPNIEENKGPVESRTLNILSKSDLENLMSAFANQGILKQDSISSGNVLNVPNLLTSLLTGNKARTKRDGDTESQSNVESSSGGHSQSQTKSDQASEVKSSPNAETENESNFTPEQSDQLSDSDLLTEPNSMADSNNNKAFAGLNGNQIAQLIFALQKAEQEKAKLDAAQGIARPILTWPYSGYTLSVKQSTVPNGTTALAIPAI